MSLNTTFVASTTVITAAHMNGIQAAWDTYGSAASFTGSSSNPSLGNGTWVGHVLQVGKHIEFWVKITMGSTTTFGTGNYRIALPVAPFAGSPCRSDVLVTDASSGAIYRGIGYTWTGTTLSLAVDNGTAGGPMQQMTPTVPMTFAVSDTLEVWGTYEAA